MKIYKLKIFHMKSIRVHKMILCYAHAIINLAVGAQEPFANTLLPDGFGLAAKYPGDIGISGDTAVVFHENLEEFIGESFTSGEMGKWDHYYHNLVITHEKENVHSGNKALQIIHNEVPGAHGAVKEVSGYDTLFLRFYMKFHPDFPATHHAGMYIRGGQKGALFDNPTGTKPAGTDHFSVTIDHLFPGHGASPEENNTPPGWIYNYCYHMDQKDVYGDILLPTGNQSGSHSLGEGFIPRANINPDRNRWYCYELMVICNTPGKHNGRVAIWLDGKLLTEQPNLSFRTVDSLKSRFITLSTYASRKADYNCMWYDDIVVAREYIGPMADKQ
jgi:hypothetical protein